MSLSFHHYWQDAGDRLLGEDDDLRLRIVRCRSGADVLHDSVKLELLQVDRAACEEWHDSHHR